MKKILITLTALFCVLILTAQNSILYTDTLPDIIDTTHIEKKIIKPVNVIEELATPDSLTEATILVFQDYSITKVIEKPLTDQLQESKGFRIQIYSSNRGASARERSFEIKEILLAKHPKLESNIYITYTSPFWKVRIGNCPTHAKAQELREWIIAEYPEFANETYIVPSIILIP